MQIHFDMSKRAHAAQKLSLICELRPKLAIFYAAIFLYFFSDQDKRTIAKKKTHTHTRKHALVEPHTTKEEREKILAVEIAPICMQ